MFSIQRPRFCDLQLRGNMQQKHGKSVSRSMMHVQACSMAVRCLVVDVVSVGNSLHTDTTCTLCSALSHNSLTLGADLRILTQLDASPALSFHTPDCTCQQATETNFAADPWWYRICSRRNWQYTIAR